LGIAPDLLVDGPADAALTLVLAHGAGAPMDSPFMATVAAGLAARGHRVVRFEFPYMAGRRHGGGRRPPDRQPVLLESWREALTAVGPTDRLAIGGKSMGGRMASLLAADAGVLGLVCLGYPFHPPGRLDKPRVEHLTELEVPTLIVQGTRDPFGSVEEVAAYRLAPAIRIAWIADGDHDFKPTRASGRDHAETLHQAIDATDMFLKSLPA